ncbi:NADPH-dependent glutamate synthase [Candidatus Bathyarchaeota archaeon]|nr:NADPH-dependent glutamate synthase [Candidatus Bathyarchaeota archaeon]
MSKWDRLKAVPMPKQPPHVRIRNFDEVALGYNEEQALIESERCLQCVNPQCVLGCPVEIDIPAFIKLLRDGKFREAILKIKEKNNLPAICGRVCPQEDQCQKNCLLGKRGDPVQIGRLERFLADWEREHGVEIPERLPSTCKRVAVIGAGPAGLTVAGDLAKLGHEVVIFESLHEPGGVLTYGIPEFRLPKRIVQAEINYIKKLGVTIKTDTLIGRLYTIPELLKDEGFDAVFIGTGAGPPIFMGISGENLSGIYSANEFLIRVNLMRSYLFPKWDTPIKIGDRVAVIGAGNVAMDAARCAIRLGAKEVHIVYRRSRAEMPARKEEIENAEEESVIFDILTLPVAYYGDERGWVRRMECIRMQLTEPDEIGRRRPVPIPGSNFTMNMDTVIVAIGRRSNPLIQQTTPGLKVNEDGTIVVDENMRTSIEGVYAGGDIVTGEATVISAMGAGRKAAKSIHEYLMRKKY